MQSFWERSLKFWVSINHCMPGSIWDRAQTLLQMGRLFPCTGHTWSQVHTPSPTDCSSSGPGKMTRFLREKGRQVNTEPALRTQAQPSARLISCVCCPHSHRGPSVRITSPSAAHPQPLSKAKCETAGHQITPSQKHVKASHTNSLASVTPGTQNQCSQTAGTWKQTQQRTTAGFKSSTRCAGCERDAARMYLLSHMH